MYGQVSIFYFNEPFFWCSLFFKNISTLRLEPTTTIVFQDWPQRCILSYLFKLLRVLSLSRILPEFPLTCILHHIWEKNLENAPNRFLLISQFPTQNSRQDFLKICFPEDERGGENYDLLYQNSIRKYEDELECRVIYILHEL